MSTKDAKRSRVGKHQMPPRPSSKSTVTGNDSGPAPTHSPSPSASRRRPRRETLGATTPLRPIDSASQHKTNRSPLLPLFHGTLDLCSKVTPKFALLTCACGLAWASLIVWILGPAASPTGFPSAAGHINQHHPGSLLDRPGPFPIADHSDEGFLLPGWTPLGHHLRFVGREAFPEQFEHWGEEPQGEVVINGVDLGPLATGDEALPRADLVLAILSGNGEVRGEGLLRRRESCCLRNGWVARCVVNCSNLVLGAAAAAGYVSTSTEHVSGDRCSGC